MSGTGSKAGGATAGVVPLSNPAGYFSLQGGAAWAAHPAAHEDDTVDFMVYVLSRRLINRVAQVAAGLLHGLRSSRR
jgi:hypothetical protein